MRYLELKVPALLLVVLLGGVMWLIAKLLPKLSVDFPARQIVAALFLVAGGAMAIAGVHEFRKVKTTVDPTKPQASTSMVQSGVFGRSRNPMYVGFLLALIAWSVYLANVAALLFTGAFVLYMNVFQIAPEERWLRAKFGDEYESYTRKVRRWL